MPRKRGRPQKRRRTKPDAITAEIIAGLPPFSRIRAIRNCLARLRRELDEEKAKHPGAGPKPKWLRLRINHIKNAIINYEHELASELLTRSRLITLAMERRRIGKTTADIPVPVPNVGWRDL